MKKLIKILSGKSIICAALLGISVYFLPPYYYSFILCGEPEIPEILKEDLEA